jgi:hypothetical protein
MTQILLYHAENGIVLATDSRAITFPSEGDDAPQFLEIKKLFPLAPNVIAVTGGVGYGVLLCQKFQRYVRAAGLDDFEEIVDSALPFFHSEIKALQRRNSHMAGRPDLDRLYVLIAGYAPHKPENPFRFVLLASEERSEPLHTMQTSRIVTIPRQLGMEYRLSQVSPSEISLDEVEILFKNFLLKMATTGDDVGAPFYFVRITANGITTGARTGSG